MITKGIQAGASTALELLGRGKQRQQPEPARAASAGQAVDRDAMRRLSSLVRAFEAAAGRAPAKATDAFRTRLEQTMTAAADHVRALSGKHAAAPVIAVVDGQGGAELNGQALAPLRTERPSPQRIQGGSDGRDTVLLDTEGRIGRGNAGSGDDLMRLSAEKIGQIDAADGDDRVNTVAASVKLISGGSGADRISVGAETVGKVHGGAGDDTLKVKAATVGSVLGGIGSDDIEVKAVTAGLIGGGKGDDSIAVTAATATVRGGRGDDAVTLNVSDATMLFGVGHGSDTVRLGRGTHLALDFGPGLTRESLTVETPEGADGAVVLRFAGGESVRLERLDRSGSVMLRFDGGETLALHGEAPQAPEAGLDARV